MAKIWRMSFRYGNQGPSLWPQCFKHNVAVITYKPIHTTNLGKFPHGLPKHLWKKLAPAQKASLRRFVYEIKKGDTIFVKEGTRIIGRGKVLRPYAYNEKNIVRDPYGSYWHHQISVQWERNFPPVDILLGSAQQFTVIELTPPQIEELNNRIQAISQRPRTQEVTEGEYITAEVTFRKRNRDIIEEKKRYSNGKCESCGFSFPNRYRIKKDCLVAHHKIPIGARTHSSKTTVDDIALLCPNCHSVAHTSNPPLSIEQIKKLLI